MLQSTETIDNALYFYPFYLPHPLHPLSVTYYFPFTYTHLFTY